MKLIIAGGRDLIVSVELITSLMAQYSLCPTEIVSGACGRPDDEYELIKDKNENYIFANGIDGCGEKWAIANNLPVKRFPAQWKAQGLSAGPKRNRTMAQYGDVLLLIWDGKSRGSGSMLREMKTFSKPGFQLIQK